MSSMKLEVVIRKENNEINIYTCKIMCEQIKASGRKAFIIWRKMSVSLTCTYALLINPLRTGGC